MERFVRFFSICSVLQASKSHVLHFLVNKLFIYLQNLQIIAVWLCIVEDTDSHERHMPLRSPIYNIVIYWLNNLLDFFLVKIKLLNWIHDLDLGFGKNPVQLQGQQHKLKNKIKYPFLVGHNYNNINIFYSKNYTYNLHCYMIYILVCIVCNLATFQMGLMDPYSLAVSCVWSGLPYQCWLKNDD